MTAEIERFGNLEPGIPLAIVLGSAVETLTRCDMRVVREEAVDTQPEIRLLLETVIHLESQPGGASDESIADFTGLGNEVVRALILKAVDQQLLVPDGTNLSLHPDLRLEGDEILSRVERRESWLAIGSRPWPIRLAETALRPVASIGDPPVRVAPESNPGLVEEWLTSATANRILEIECRASVADCFALHGVIDRDPLRLIVGDKRTATLSVPGDHPWATEVRAECDRTLAYVGDLLREMGTWSAETFTLACDLEGWQRWLGQAGSVAATVFVRADSRMVFGVPALCVPVDTESRRAMFLHILLRALQGQRPPVLEKQIAETANNLVSRHPWAARVRKLPTPEALAPIAWDEGLWALSYTLAARQDGL